MNGPLLQLTEVSRHYQLGDQDVVGLKSTSLQIEHAAFIALTGPSGSGKSTLLNLCGLIDRPDSGEVRFEGQAVSRLDEHVRTRLRRQQIGFIFQSYNLVPVMSVYENVAYPLQLEGDRKAVRPTVEAMLERVGLSPYADHRPDHISGGQRQRVAIARALVKRPQLVVADEPTANLDSTTATQIIELMHEIAREQQTTFLVATHDPRMAERCETQLELVDGEVV